MAAIDKIYVDSWEKYQEFKEWCEKQPLFTDKYGKQEPMTIYVPIMETLSIVLDIFP